MRVRGVSQPFSSPTAFHIERRNEWRYDSYRSKTLGS